MVSYCFDQSLPYPRHTVFAWHMRSGALTRLTPPFLATVVREPEHGIHEGARAELRLRHLPGELGAWTREYRDVRPDESFAAVDLRSPLEHWHQRHVFEELNSGMRLRDEVDFEIPAAWSGPLRPISLPAVTSMARRYFAYRHRQLLDDLALAASHPAAPMTVAVSGSSGLIGKQLTALLGTMGHRVVPIVRAREPLEGGAVAWDPATGWIDAAALSRADAVVHLAGEPIGRRFTEGHMAAVRDSRVRGTRLLAATLADLREGPRVLVTASGIGYYGARPGGVVRESSPAGDDFLALTCLDWEEATEPAAAAGLRVVRVRTGIVMTPAGGSLPRQLPLFRAGIGGRIGAPDSWVSWISIDDVVGVYAHALLTPSLSGPLNAVAPEPVTSAEFAAELGRVLHRPAAIPVPDLGPRLLLGRQGAAQTAFASQRVSSGALEASGYRFRHPTLDTALAHVLGAER